MDPWFERPMRIKPVTTQPAFLVAGTRKDPTLSMLSERRAHAGHVRSCRASTPMMLPCLRATLLKNDITAMLFVRPVQPPTGLFRNPSRARPFQT